MMIEFILSVMASLLASVLWFQYRNSFSPKIKISNNIALGASVGKKAFKIKVLNVTKRPIFNVKAEMFLTKIYQEQEGQSEVTQEIPLKKNELIELGPFLNSWQQHPDHIWRFLTYIDLNELLKSNDGSYLKFIVSGFDSISGKGKTFVKRYRTSEINIGEFFVDNRMDIKK